MGQSAVQPGPAGQLWISAYARQLGLCLHPRCRLSADVGRLFVDGESGAADLARAVDPGELGNVFWRGQPARQRDLYLGERLSELLLGMGSGGPGAEPSPADSWFQNGTARRHIYPAAAQACRLFGAAGLE